MDVNTVYGIILYAVAKNKSQGYVSPDDFNNVLMPVAQAGYMDYLLGEYQKYQIRRPISVVEIGQNERISTSISPLIYGKILNIYNTGICPLPSDFEYANAMWGVYGYYNIRFVNQDRLDSTLHSTIDTVQVNPIYLINHEGFQFFPEDIGVARLSYVRTPPSIFWAYSKDVNDLPVYDPINSQQPIWADSDIYQIIVRALALVGVNLQLNTVIGYTNDIKNGGQ